MKTPANLTLEELTVLGSQAAKEALISDNQKQAALQRQVHSQEITKIGVSGINPTEAFVNQAAYASSYSWPESHDTFTASHIGWDEGKITVLATPQSIDRTSKTGGKT